MSLLSWMGFNHLEANQLNLKKRFCSYPGSNCLRGPLHIEQRSAGPSKITLPESFSSFSAAVGVISTPIGALLAGILVEIFGRKFVVQATNVPLVIGWICIALSSSILPLCIGRFITGIGQGNFPSQTFSTDGTLSSYDQQLYRIPICQLLVFWCWCW